MQLFNHEPSFLVEVDAINHIDKSFSYDEREDRVVDGHLVKVKTGVRRDVKRHVIQAVGHDPDGVSFFCYMIPCRDYVPSFVDFCPGKYKFAVQSVRPDDNGGLLCYFSGFEALTPPKK